MCIRDSDVDSGRRRRAWHERHGVTFAFSVTPQGGDGLLVGMGIEL